MKRYKSNIKNLMLQYVYTLCYTHNIGLQQVEVAKYVDDYDDANSDMTNTADVVEKWIDG